MTLYTHGSVTRTRGGRARVITVGVSLLPAFHRNALQNPPLCGGEADNLPFASADDVRRRHESHLDVFPGAGDQITAATQVELVFDVFPMALDGFYTQVKRVRDLAVSKA